VLGWCWGGAGVVQSSSIVVDAVGCDGLGGGVKGFGWVIGAVLGSCGI
jgi:hypothetical protein